jgi:hypothetical protein
MSEHKIKLANNYQILATDYAGQGNAILGIRDSGKTYTGTKAAEGLLDSGIPIIVFDPIGVWKNLKIGVGKHKGYPIVVAGGEGSDIRLTPTNAVEIVKAAMKENVSLVIDLYSPELINKSTWIKIVQETVDELMYHNKAYGMRHIFLEEAAEFIPQRLQPQHSRVYASIERLARMGRNAHLGMTIINQRAEEVNKAILEIMAICFLHKQVGKNSLLSIKKWLELRSLDKNADDIINKLPQLQKGECFVISDAPPLKIQVLEKNTFHPDAKKPVDPVISKLAINVSSFVEKMNEQLKKKEKPAKPTNSKLSSHPIVNANQLSKIEEQNSQLQIRNGQLLAELKEEQRLSKEWARLAVHRGAALKKIYEEASMIKETITDPLKKIVGSVTKVHQNGTGIQKNDTKVKESVQPVPFEGDLSKTSRKVIKFLASLPDREFTVTQLGVLTKYSPTSGGFSTALGQLNSLGLIIRSDRKIKVNKNAIREIESMAGSIDQQEFGIETYKDKLNKCEREIYEVLLEHPDQSFTKEELANKTETNYSYSSGGFSSALGKLNTLQLIERRSGQIKLNPELLELMEV